MSRTMKKTKIIATIGPASEDPKTLEQMINAGMNVARLNFSHGSHDEHLNRIKNLRKISKKLDRNAAILADTKGPEIRTKKFENGVAKLVKGNKIIITDKNILGNENYFTTTYNKLSKEVKVGQSILLDDGLIELKVNKIKDKDIHCKILNSGIIKDNKGINIPGSKINLKFISEKDRQDIIFACQNLVDFIAISFVRDAEDIKKVCQIINKQHHKPLLIAKIENQRAVDNIDEIIKASDGVMVARGDLGVEVYYADVPLIQKAILRKCLIYGKPSITATQMLESMSVNPRPTRAEVNDVTNAILDGTDAIMLSGETASGKYPVEAVKIQSEIARRAESTRDYKKIIENVEKSYNEIPDAGLVDIICLSAVKISNFSEEIKLIITPTSTGATTLRLARFRPKHNILAITPSRQISRSLSNIWGVKPIVRHGKIKNIDDMLTNAIVEAKRLKLVKKGDHVLVLSGEIYSPGNTSMLKVMKVK